MIEPAPTSTIAPGIARGVLVRSSPTLVAITFPNTSYEVHLVPDGSITTEPGKRITGRIRVQGRRIDVSQSGGKYLEPVVGRLTRVQGRVIAIEGEALIVDASVPVYLIPTERGQKASGFVVGDFVTCNVKTGALFQPVAV